MGADRGVHVMTDESVRMDQGLEPLAVASLLKKVTAVPSFAAYGIGPRYRALLASEGRRFLLGFSTGVETCISARCPIHGLVHFPTGSNRWSMVPHSQVYIADLGCVRLTLCSCWWWSSWLTSTLTNSLKRKNYEV